MSTASISRQLARECIDLADATEDEEQARALFAACKAFLKAALREECTTNAAMQHRIEKPGQYCASLAGTVNAMDAACHDGARKIGNDLRARLAELRTHHAKVDHQMRQPLPADSEDQASNLKINKHSKGSKKPRLLKSGRLKPRDYPTAHTGTCVKCGKSIDPRRLKALPTAATCISCSAGFKYSFDRSLWGGGLSAAKSFCDQQCAT